MGAKRRSSAISRLSWLSLSGALEQEGPTLTKASDSCCSGVTHFTLCIFKCRVLVIKSDVSISTNRNAELGYSVKVR